MRSLGWKYLQFDVGGLAPCPFFSFILDLFSSRPWKSKRIREEMEREKLILLYDFFIIYNTLFFSTSSFYFGILLRNCSFDNNCFFIFIFTEKLIRYLWTRNREWQNILIIPHYFHVAIFVFVKFPSSLSREYDFVLLQIIFTVIPLPIRNLSCYKFKKKKKGKNKGNY